LCLKTLNTVPRWANLNGSVGSDAHKARIRKSFGEMGYAYDKHIRPSQGPQAIVMLAHPKSIQLVILDRDFHNFPEIILIDSCDNIDSEDNIDNKDNIDSNDRQLQALS
jgi:hypothetical protein